MRPFLFALMTLSACAREEEASEPAPSETQPFVLARNDATATRGAQWTPGFVIEFVSTSEGTSHESVVRVGEKRFTFRRDDKKGQFTVEGAGASLDAVEKLALTTLLKRAEKIWVADDKVGPRAPIPMHGAMLLGELSWLSTVRPGMQIATFVRERLSTVIPGIAHTVPRFSGERTFDYGAEPFTNVGLYCASQYDGSWIWAQIMPWNGTTNVREEQLAKVNATGGTESACADGFTNQGGNGCGNWECQGQCGVGCLAWWHNGRFTDCFEHDVCTDFHADADCDRDKFSAASAFVDSYAALCR